jgi:hypothetical protein
MDTTEQMEWEKSWPSIKITDRSSPHYLLFQPQLHLVNFTQTIELAYCYFEKYFSSKVTIQNP